ncbi:MAG: HugZ family protein [Planctomycetes bacterium]|nr:HugZ family protein [Planctomycetota bacterium]
MTDSLSIEKQLQSLIDGCRTVILATASPDGVPNASYAPFVDYDGSFFVLVSGLAKHTGNLLSTEWCHALFITDEKETVNVFARKRLSYNCEAFVVEIHGKMKNESDALRADTVLAMMEERFGPTIKMLRSLPDFRLIELKPSDGTLVLGFGQAIPVHGRKPVS